MLQDKSLGASSSAHVPDSAVPGSSNLASAVVLYAEPGDHSLSLELPPLATQVLLGLDWTPPLTPRT